MQAFFTSSITGSSISPGTQALTTGNSGPARQGFIYSAAGLFYHGLVALINA